MAAFIPGALVFCMLMPVSLARSKGHIINITTKNHQAGDYHGYSNSTPQRSAKLNKPERRYRTHELAIRLLKKVLSARKSRRHAEILKLYGSLADTKTHYILGGARMYLAQWTVCNRYALAAAGLIWLTVNPLTPFMASSETLKRRALHVEPVVAPQQALVGVAC